jgi:hypothetical protein
MSSDECLIMCMNEHIPTGLMMSTKVTAVLQKRFCDMPRWCVVHVKGWIFMQVTGT